MEQGIQVTPMSDAEVTMLRSLLERFGNAVVSWSSLQGEVEDLRRKVTALDTDASLLRVRNRELNDQAELHRKQIDERDATISELHSRLDAMERRALAAENQAVNISNDDSERIKRLENDITWVNQQLTEVRRERDDWELKFMENDDKLNKAQTWIRAIRDLFQNAPEV